MFRDQRLILSTLNFQLSTVRAADSVVRQTSCLENNGVKIPCTQHSLQSSKPIQVALVARNRESHESSAMGDQERCVELLRNFASPAKAGFREQFLVDLGRTCHRIQQSICLPTVAVTGQVRIFRRVTTSANVQMGNRFGCDSSLGLAVPSHQPKPGNWSFDRKFRR